MVGVIRIHQIGGPEVLEWEDVELAAPAAGEVQIAQTAVGLNYIDVYHRTGLYPVELPSGLGAEGAGTVAAVGDGVADLAVGDRVAYVLGPLGAYAEARNLAAARVVKLPDGVSETQAAAMMLQGLTVQYLIRQTFRVAPGMTVLFHAAAGGVGLIACQWLKHLGADVIGTVGSAAKGELAAAHGCDHVINYRDEDFVARVREITGGAGVPVVYDGVGKDTFEGSLDCLAPRGMLVSFGNASGAVTAFNPGVLAAKGSLYLTRPTLGNYAGERNAYVAMTEEMFGLIASGAIKVEVNQTYPLKDAAQAHRDLEARKTTGSTVLVPKGLLTTVRAPSVLGKTVH